MFRPRSSPQALTLSPPATLRKKFADGLFALRSGQNNEPLLDPVTGLALFCLTPAAVVLVVFVRCIADQPAYGYTISVLHEPSICS